MVLSVLALYLNVFVLLAQLFQKTPILASIAPNPQAPAFAITQGLVLALADHRLEPSRATDMPSPSDSHPHARDARCSARCSSFVANATTREISVVKSARARKLSVCEGDRSLKARA